MRRDTGQETVHGPGTDGQTSFDWLGLGGFNHRSSATRPKVNIGDSDADHRMRAYVEVYGCTLNFGEPREIEEALSGNLGLRSFCEVKITDATPTCLIGERGDTR